MQFRHAFAILFHLLAATLPAQVTFTDRTDLLFLPNGTSSGVAVAVADMNNDGKDDIVRLKNADFLQVEYQQEPNEDFLHAVLAFGPEHAWSMAVADANNDGFCDVIFGGSYDEVKLVESDPDGSYSLSYLPGPDLFVQGSNFADINNDGLLDIFACHDDAESRIWGNSGSGFFTANDWIDMATSPASDNSGNYGSTWTDFDNDGDLDLYISKCRLGVSNPNDPRRINALFVNDGNGNFYEDAEEYGLKIGHQSWAADFQDIDNDGDLDCLLANHDAPLQLFENDGTGHFTDISNSSGVGNHLGFYYQSLMRDFDNDGFVDIICAHPELFLKNNGDKTFSNFGASFSGMNTLAVGDLNSDGFLDLYAAYQCGYTTPCGNPDKLWMNDGNGNNYIAIRLQGNASNYKGVGARVEIHGPWGIQVREIRAGESYGISNSLTAFFGLRTATSVDSVVVKWPSGIIDVHQNLDINQYHLLEEGLTCAAPDVAISVDGFSCENGAANFEITLCNQGFADMPSGLPIAFFEKDPRQMGATFLASAETDLTVPVGECRSFSFSINAEPNTEIFAVANENGSSTLPLSANNLTAGVEECGYSDNFASLFFSHNPTLLELGDDQAFCNIPSTTIDPGNVFHFYEWQNGSTNQTYTAENSGTYSITVTDACGIEQSDSIFVELTQAPPIDLGDDREICEGESTFFEISDYSNIEWSPSIGLSCVDCPNPIGTPESTSLYSVTATEGACTFSDEILISVNMPPSLDVTGEDTDCNSAASVSTAANGNSPFSYIWSNGETSEEIFPTQTGNYSVTVEDINGCQSIGSASIVYHEWAEINLESTPLICADNPTGKIDLNINGGEGPFDILWSNGATSENISNLISGNYSVTVTDEIGCTYSENIDVESPPNLIVNYIVDEIKCANGTGNIFTQTSGGTPPYSYLWSNGEIASSLADIPVGYYSATVTDNNGCEEIISHNMTEPPPILVSLEVDTIICFGGTGSIYPEASGGLEPYGYFWSNFSFEQNLINVTAGEYSATITDANDCTTIFEYNLENPEELTTSESIENIDCQNENGNGQAILYPENGTPPYLFNWDNGANSDTLMIQYPGTYTATVSDANGCYFTHTVHINTMNSLTEEYVYHSISCHPDNGTSDDGWFAVIPHGVPPFTYIWNTGETDSLITGLSQGTYSFEITDDRGCSASGGMTFEHPPYLNATISASDSTLCLPDSTELLAFVGGGTFPYSILWNTGDTTEYMSVYSTGEYSSTITDANGCTNTGELTIIASPEMKIYLDTIFPASNATAQDGAIFHENISGGIPPYSYLWNTGDTTFSIENIFPGTYFLTILDSIGCDINTAYTVDFLVGTNIIEPTNWTAIIFPNPIKTHESLFLEINAKRAKKLSAYIYQNNGQLIWKNQFEINHGLAKKTLEWKPQSTGIYLLRIIDEYGHEKTWKIIVN